MAAIDQVEECITMVVMLQLSPETLQQMQDIMKPHVVEVYPNVLAQINLQKHLESPHPCRQQLDIIMEV